MKLSDIKPNPNNPRLIKDEKFVKLVNSIRDFPKMMALRPIVVNDDMIVLGGNMRLKALNEIGYKEIPDEWVKKSSELTADEQRRFIILDNVSGGEWDWQMIQQDWDVKDLEEWGVDVVSFESDIDYSDKNKEIDTDFEDQKYFFKLEYSEQEYTELKEKIQETGKTPEQLFYESLISI